MKVAAIRWMLYLAAAIVLGPAAGWAIEQLHSPWGYGRPQPMLASPLVSGVFALSAVVLLAALGGLVTARLSGARSGMIVAGIVLAWAASATSRMDEVLRLSRGRGIVVPVTLEAIILLVCGTVLVARMTRFGRVVHQSDAPIPGSIRATLARPRTLGILGLGLVAASLAAWFIGVSPLKWQCIAAAIGAGVAAGAAGRIIDDTAPLVLLILPAGSLAVLAPILGFIITGPSNIVAAADAGQLFRLLQIAPLEWLAGGLIGVPWGAGWAGSMVDQQLERLRQVEAAR